MIDLATLSPPVRAGVLVGAVFLEAIVLYVGYGVVEQVAADPIIERIENA
ncbi:hypothetical protein OB955_23715 [Halobacteria archaeon AArc-m2/3/4]|uniref:Uncharacterized protein n=1 Tax=Natronoglomus mannanivorans TaxID=2979990 RepID=A0ABT2QL80_9EURY|nr:hypothetical protein [Halobacteria archaeon AArc-m2/3/4]